MIPNAQHVAITTTPDVNPHIFDVSCRTLAYLPGGGVMMELDVENDIPDVLDAEVSFSATLDNSEPLTFAKKHAVIAPNAATGALSSLDGFRMCLLSSQDAPGVSSLRIILPVLQLNTLVTVLLKERKA